MNYVVSASKVLDRYQIEYGNGQKGEKYTALEIPFNYMDSMWMLMQSLVDRGLATHATCSTKIAHHWFHMTHANMTVHYLEKSPELELMLSQIAVGKQKERKTLFT